MQAIDLSQVSDAKPTSVRIATHACCMMLAALGNPLLRYDTQPVFVWLTTWLAPLILAGVAYAIYFAVARQRANAVWPTGFFPTAWVILAIVVATPYIDRAKRGQQAAPAQAPTAQGVPFDQRTARKVEEPQAINWEKGVMTPPSNKP